MCQPCHKVSCKQKMHTYVCLLGMLRSPFLCNCSVFQLMLWQLLLHCHKCNSLFLVQETSSSDDVCYRPQYLDLQNNDKILSPNLQKTIWYLATKILVLCLCTQTDCILLALFVWPALYLATQSRCQASCHIPTCLHAPG